MTTPGEAGKWRFSLFDGRFVYDTPSKHGFMSDRWYDPQPFAGYVTGLEAALNAQAERIRTLEAALEEAEGALEEIAVSRGWDRKDWRGLLASLPAEGS